MRTPDWQHYIVIRLSFAFTVAIGISTSLIAQTIPQNPNQVVNGLRQGKWTLMFDANWNVVTNVSQASFYRVIEYQQGKPAGTTRDYFANGKLQWEGQLVSENPDVNNGLCIWYKEDGTKDRETHYVNGKREGKEIIFSNGKKYAEGTYTEDKKNNDWIYYGNDYGSVYATATQQYQLKDYSNAESTFKKAVDLAFKTFGPSSVQYRDTRWWMYFLYDDVNKTAEATSALKDAVRTSAVLRDEFEVRVIEDVERYADKLKNNNLNPESVVLYRLAARTRQQRNWMTDASYYKDLKGIMDITYRLKQYDSTEFYFEKIVTILPPTERILGTHLSDWASFTIGQKQPALMTKVEKACETYLKDKEAKNEKDAGYAEAWIAFGKIQHAGGQYERALKSFADARKSLVAEQEQRLYLSTLTLSAATYNASKKYDANASSVFDEYEKWNDRFATYLEGEYVDNMTEVVRYATNNKDYPRAERVLLKLLPATEKQFGKQSSEYKMVAMTLSGAYEAQGKVELAKSVKPALSSSDQKDIANAVGIGRANEDLDQLQKALKAGRFAEAVIIFERSLSLLKSHYESSGDYDGFVTISSAIAACYQQTGELFKAGQLLLTTKQIADQHLGKSSETYISMLLALGDYYAATGALQDADNTFYSGMQTLDQVKSTGNAKQNDALYYQLAERLAGVLARERYFGSSEDLYGRVLAYHEKNSGKNSLTYQYAATSLADLYQRMRLFALAADLYEDAMPVLKKELGEQSATYIDASRTLANLYLLKGDYTAAEAPFLKAKTHYQTALGTRSDRYLGVLSDLGLLYTFSGQLAKAAPVYHEHVALHLDKVKNLFPLLSEKEKANFYSLTQSQFNTFNVFAMGQLKTNPAEAAEMYNLQLVSKSLLFKASDRVRSSVVNSKDQNLKNQYSHWKDSREQLSRIYQLTDQQKKAAGIDEKQLEKKVNELERELTLKSELFARLISDTPDWKAVKNALKPGEAAVEMVRIVEALPEFTFDYIGKGITIDTLNEEGYARVNNLAVKCPAVKAGVHVGETIVSINDKSTQGKSIDNVLQMLSANPAKLVLRKKNSKVTYSVQINGDSVFYRSYPKKVRYVALVITPEAQTPRAVTIANGDELETRYARFYRNAIQNQLDDPYSYKVFWQPVKNILGSATRIYFSPDGVYNSINPNTLVNPETKRFVLDDAELILVTNTADILKPTGSSRSRKAILFGFPDYNKTATSSAPKEASEFMLLKKDSAQRFMSGNNIAELPGTRVEVNTIEGLLKSQLEVTKFMSADATEEKIKSVQAPKVLHIATHGFFLDQLSQSDEDQRGITGISRATLAENPLLRSGLLLAGAAKTINEGRQNTQSEDGVLTAYEAMNLDLNETEMVVLSACETGLGQIQTGEGVYGLQRAFRAAGAQSVLMSLWKVNDESTQKLMTGFYSEWIQKGRKQTAFREAQLKLRQQFPHPFYWGAFVMIGQ